MRRFEEKYGLDKKLCFFDLKCSLSEINGVFKFIAFSLKIIYNISQIQIL